MTLTLNVDVEHSSVTLKEQHALVPGTTYSPFRLEFSQNYNPVAANLQVKLYRPDTGDYLADALSFVQDPNEPSIYNGQLNLAVSTFDDWVNSTLEDSDPSTSVPASVRIVVCEESSENHTAIVYANCEVPIILSKGVAVTQSGDSEFATKEFVHSQIKKALSDLGTGGSTSPDDPSISPESGTPVVVRGEVTSYDGQPISFKVEGTDIVIGGQANETAPRTDCLYYDIKTRVLYGAAVQPSAGLQVVGSRLVKDVRLEPLSDEPFTLGSLGTEVPVIKFADKALLCGYYDPEYDEFFCSNDPADVALRPNNKRLTKSQHVLYFDYDKGILYRYDEKQDAAGNGFQPVVPSVSPEAFVSTLTVSDSMSYTQESGYAVSTKESIDESTGGKVVEVEGVLSSAIVSGYFDAAGKFVDESLNSGTVVQGDPRKLYITNSGIYRFDKNTQSFVKCGTNESTAGFVKQIKTTKVDDPCLPDTEGVVDISSLVNTVITGKLTDLGFKTDAGLITEGSQGVLYIDIESQDIYMWETEFYVAVPGHKDPGSVVTSIELNNSTIKPDQDGKVNLGTLPTSVYITGTYVSPDIFRDSTGKDVAKVSSRLYFDVDQNTIYKNDPNDQRFYPIIKPVGEPNVIDKVRLNGQDVPVSEGKTVDLGDLLTSAVYLGTVDANFLFTPEGSTSKIDPDKAHFYVDVNTKNLYVRHGDRLVQLAKPTIESIEVNSETVPVSEGCAQLGSVVSEVIINGQAVANDKGRVNIDVAQPGDIQLQRQVSVGLSYETGELPVKLTNDHVNSGTSIFTGRASANIGVTLDLSDAVAAQIFQNRAYSFEVWVHNDMASSPIMITRPQEAFVGTDGSTVPITWLSGESNTTVQAQTAVYMSFRVAPGWTYNYRKPVVQAAIYCVG